MLMAMSVWLAGDGGLGGERGDGGAGIVAATHTQRQLLLPPPLFLLLLLLLLTLTLLSPPPLPLCSTLYTANLLGTAHSHQLSAGNERVQFGFGFVQKKRIIEK